MYLFLYPVVPSLEATSIFPNSHQHQKKKKDRGFFSYSSVEMKSV